MSNILRYISLILSTNYQRTPYIWWRSVSCTESKSICKIENIIIDYVKDDITIRTRIKYLFIL